MDLKNDRKRTECVHPSTKTCKFRAQGKTIIELLNERVKAPQTAYERAFYAKNIASPAALASFFSRRVGNSKHIPIMH